MKGYTHLAIGLGAGLVMKDTLESWGIVMTGLGSILPDLDHPKSLLGRRIPGASIIGLKHRGWMYSLLGLIVFVSISTAIDSRLAPAIALGYMLHLLADTLNPSGISWFYPFYKKRIHIIGIPSGSLWENILVLGLIFYIISTST